MNEQIYDMPPPMPNMPYGVGMGVSNAPSNDATIASMRWESDPITWAIYKDLGACEPMVTPEGKIELVAVEGVHPLMNNKGIRATVALIKSNINPAVSLSNFDDEEANMLIKQTCIAYACQLALNNELWGVDVTDMHTIQKIVNTLVFSQVKRAVAGHEATNFQTQVLEHNVQQHYSQGNNGGGFSLLPGMFRRK